MTHAIETLYNGYRFRSRTEARWAVFMDAVGVHYEYEAQGYELPVVGRYLPDFYISEWNAFVEVKGEQPNQRDMQCAAFLAATKLTPVFMFFGPVGPWNRRPLTVGDLSVESACLAYYRRQKEDVRVDELARKLSEKSLQPYLECRQAITEMAKDDSLTSHELLGPDVTCDWVECEGCARVRIGPPGGGARAFCACTAPRWSRSTTRLLDAYVKARSARFEHGEGWRP